MRLEVQTFQPTRMPELLDVLKAQDMTIADFAKAFGWSKSGIWRVVHGQRSAPGFFFERAEAILGVRLDTPPAAHCARPTRKKDAA